MVNLINAIKPLHATIASIGAAYTGSVLGEFSIDIYMQRGAWLIAMIAGMVAIINGTKSWYKKKKTR